MPRTRTYTAMISAAALLAGLTVVSATATAGAAPGPARVALPGSVAPFTASTRVTGAVPGARRLSIELWLRPRTAAASRFATAVATPGSALFHHYLSPAGYTARFGPSQAAEQRVAAWLRGAGFTGVSADPGRAYVRATASVTTINAALSVRLQNYRSTAAVGAGPYALRASSRPVHLPAALAASVLGVTGLDNAAPVLPLAQAKPTGPACARYYGQVLVHHLSQAFGTTTFPLITCGYSGPQLRSAYGASYASDGRGQTVALVELGLTQDMPLTLRDYASREGLPRPGARQYAQLSLGGGARCGDPFDVEEQLDVEQAYNMAPGAHLLVVGGDACDEGDYGAQGLVDADEAILDGAHGHPLARIASNSWESGSEIEPTGLIDIENAYLVRAAAEGVGMYFSAGDSPGVNMPSSDPFATAVGGTSLGIGAAGQRLFETGWSDAEAFPNGPSWETDPFVLFGTGGGPSVLWRQPHYQHGVVPAALASPGGNRGLVRSVPDLSAVADLITGVQLGILAFAKHKPPHYTVQKQGGTSVAAPLVAGLVADAQQGQRTPFGFLNPALYRLAGTSAINDALPATQLRALYRGVVACQSLRKCQEPTLNVFDYQNTAAQGYLGQVTLRGYDNMTGLGSPHGQAFIRGLRRVAG
jgi:subtilase family serine protease